MYNRAWGLLEVLRNLTIPFIIIFNLKKIISICMCLGCVYTCCLERPELLDPLELQEITNHLVCGPCLPECPFQPRGQ